MKNLYIKYLPTGVCREYGKNQHDSLVSFDHGMTLQYYNLQNCEGSINEYRFCDDCGNVLEADSDSMGYANIGGFQSSTKDISMNEELRNAIEMIKNECKSREDCIGCPMSYKDEFMNDSFCRCSLAINPELWDIEKMEGF